MPVPSSRTLQDAKEISKLLQERVKIAGKLDEIGKNSASISERLKSKESERKNLEDRIRLINMSISKADPLLLEQEQEKVHAFQQCC